MPSEFQNSLLSDLESGLRRLESRSQRRSLQRVAGVNLCSNDYLGLSQREELRAAILSAVRGAEYVGGTGSRLLSGHFAEWEKLEHEFAAFAGTETSLYFGSGYAANVGLLSSLLSKGDVVFSDELNHASIIDGIRLSGARKEIYRHRDLSALESALKAHVGERCRRIIVTESVFSMDGDVADVSALVALAERFGASVIVDEAHATAVHGPHGRGIVAACGLEKRVLAALHTCGKALASAGAFVCGSAVLKEHLVNHARTFIFSTAMPPYFAAQIGAALRFACGMDFERRELLDGARKFAHSLREEGWDVSAGDSQIIPCIVGQNDEALAAAEFLQGEGFAVRAIRPPTVPEGKARLRFSLTSLTGANDLTRLCDALGAWRASKEAHAAAVRP
ncbi:MAG: 8-amino-7-oxononanoate synthase [Acidobacteria bacterium]|nr:8-amino-7-oxononanoate synthase [Acidobacteriota bacterium]MBS1867369.1 8-amino-7-oxononanoate synthase [Acidobacteriota bacterium]